MHIRKPLAILLAFSILVLPLSAAASGRPAGMSPAPTDPAAISILEAAEVAAASGIYRAQNTAQITTGIIREDDKRRSAIAFALSGLLAFGGAALWRWLPCRDTEPHDPGIVGGVALAGYNKCYNDDGSRKGFDTPTRAMIGAGFVLELVSLGYLIAHMRSNDDDDASQDAASGS